MIGMLRILSFILFLLGIFYLLRLNITDVIQELSAPFNARDNLKEKILLAQGKRKKYNFYLLIEDTRNIL